jgi:hypothetical protein
MSFNSLTIEIIKRTYTEDMIINVFWKYFLGKIYRVDFEPIVYDDVPGTWNFEYQKATIYKDEKCEWSDEIIKSINKTGNFVLYYTNFDGSNDCWTMYKNTNPIPRATTLGNIHQLQHNNKLLCAHINKLEKELSEVKNKTN